jgi:citrate lyase beta subunit
MLFVPGDSERKLAKAAASPADALILDLEDSVAASRTAVAREQVLEFLRARRDRRQQLWVRINPGTPAALQTSPWWRVHRTTSCCQGRLDADVAAVAHARCAGDT